VYDGQSVQRFTVIGDTGSEVVLDGMNGLVWKKTWANEKDWPQALAYCEALSYGGYDDWKLPNIAELRSLVDIDSYSPATAFPDFVSEYFWSSTSWTGYENHAWVVNFEDGTVSCGVKTGLITAYVLCVRSGS